MNKRQRKKRDRKQGYIIGIDLSSLPDHAAYLPYTVICHICSKLMNDSMGKVEYRVIHGEGIRNPKGLTAAGEGNV